MEITGKPLSMMVSLSIDKRVKTRIKQYEAFPNSKLASPIILYHRYFLKQTDYVEIV